MSAEVTKTIFSFSLRVPSVVLSLLADTKFSERNVERTIVLIFHSPTLPVNPLGVPRFLILAGCLPNVKKVF